MVLRILLIDDNPDDRLLAIRSLKRELADLHIEEVIDAEGFEQALSNVEFDLCICDYQLQWSNGIKILRILKARYPERPVIMFTNSGSEEIAVEAMKIGADDYVIKSPKYYNRLGIAVRSAWARTQAQQKAAMLEMRLNSLMNRLDVGVFRYNQAGQLLECNAAFMRLLGLHSSAEPKAINLQELYFPSVNTLAPGNHEREVQLKRADGSSIWVALNEVLTNIDNEIVIDGFMEDISARKQIEAELIRANELFQVAATTVNSIVYVWDLQKNYIEPQHGFTQVLGYTLAEAKLTGDWWIERIHPQDQQQTVQKIQAALTNSDDFSLEYRIRHKDDYYLYVWDRALIVRNDEGVAIRVIGSSLDITQRKQKEKQDRFLSEASKILASSLDYETTLKNVAELAVPNIADFGVIFLLEESGQIGSMSTNDNHPVKQSLFNQLQIYSQNPKTQTPVSQVLTTGKSLLLLNATTASVSQSVVIVPLIVGGKILGILAFSSEPSSRQYSQESLVFIEELARRSALAIDHAKLYREAQEANRMKDEFLATLSHELRSPLNAILGWSTLLRSRQLDRSTYTRAIETIERNAKLQTTLIEDILDVSRMTRGQLRLNVKPVDLATIIEASLDAIRLAAEAKNITINTALDPLVGPVLGDPDRLQQIVWNLLSNAIKFTLPGGNVKIELARELKVEGWQVSASQLTKEQKDDVISLQPEELLPTIWSAKIQIRDTGIGINPKFLPYVFDRFRQADASNTRSQGGLGIGLAIVRNLVELHGGTIDASSLGEGKGATFTVYLPLLNDESKRLKNDNSFINTSSFTPRPLLERLQILVVDDEEDTRELITLLLEQEGATVKPVGSVQKAISVLEQFPIDLIISDIGMPEENGYVLIAYVQKLQAQQKRTIPALALTAFAREEDRVRSLQAGFQEHLAKPIEPTQLIAAVARLAGRD